MLIGGTAVVVAVAAAAIFLSQRPAETVAAAPAASPPAVTAPIVDSALPVQPPPAAIRTATVPAVAAVESLALADSAKARNAAAKTAILAKADSLRKKTDQGRTLRSARWAASALLADVEAKKAFIRGATRSGGLLGSKRRGDLQTQIDALQPFLTKNGLTYDQFKQVVAVSGFNIFDEFGRMVPDSLQRFASAAN